MNQQAKQVIKDLPPCHLYFNKGITINKPEILMKMETSHIMILFFYIGGLHILDKEQALDENQLREKLVEYIMSLKQSKGGFGSCPLYASFPKASKYEQSHIVFIFSAVNSLFILKAGDRLDKAQILSNLARYQKQDGSFSSFPSSTECDLRFVYSALSVCKLFGDFSQIDTAKAQKYIESCFNFDGGFGLRPRNQSHCGAVFCAVASYSCLGLCLPPRQKQKIVHFLVNRQVPHTVEKLVGIQGRVGKHPDSCYSFWAGASLQLLVGRNLLNPEIEQFLMACFKKEQCSFAKFMQNTSGDPVHTFHSIIGLKILGEQADDIELRHLLKKKLIG